MLWYGIPAARYLRRPEAADESFRPWRSYEVGPRGLRKAGIPQAAVLLRKSELAPRARC